MEVYDPANSASAMKPTASQAWGWVTLCLLLALGTFVLSPIASGGQHPPVVYPEWVLVGLISTGAIALALWCSARCGAYRITRLVLAVAILLGLLALGFPLFSYYGSFHDYPWAVVIPLAVALVVGGWRYHQRWLTFALPAFILFWFHGAAQRPRTTLPASITQNGLTVTVQSLERNQRILSCGFQLAWKPGVKAAQYDLSGIRLEGAVSPGVPVRCWPPHQWPTDIQGSPHAPAFVAATFPPSWSRSFDLTITVPSWPKRPATSVTVAVPPRKGVTARSSPRMRDGGGLRLSASNVRWSTSRTATPAPRCLVLEIDCVGYSPVGLEGKELRVTDDRGNKVPIRGSFPVGSQSDATMEVELWPIAPGVKRLRIDAFTEAQRGQNQHVFQFKGLPNSTVNLVNLDGR